jgi:hypothetical protein
MLKSSFHYKILNLHSFLFFFGALLWFKFFFGDNPEYNNFDWVVLNQWLGVAKLGFDEHQIPYYATFFREEIETGVLLWGNKFFSIPYLITSPQIFLLKITSIKFFYGIHFYLTYIISFFFYKKWVSSLKLNNLSSTFLFFGLFFSGPLIGRMAVGHLQLTAYFLVPGFLYILWNIYNSLNLEFKSKNFIKDYFPLTALFIYAGAQGSLHVLQQWLIVGSLLFILKPRKLVYFYLSFFLAVACLTHIFIPNLLFGTYIGDLSRGYQTGFIYEIISTNINFNNSSFLIFINNILNIYPMLTSSVNYGLDGSWEVSLYVGYIYSLILIYGIFKYLRWKNIEWTFIATLALIFLSCGGVLIAYKIITYVYYVPLVDRLSVRLLIYPFFVIILLAANTLNKVSVKSRIYYVFMLLVLASSIEILINFSGWQVAGSSQSVLNSQNILTGQPKIYEPTSLEGRSLFYERATIICYILSLIFNLAFFVTWIIHQLRNK